MTVAISDQINTEIDIMASECPNYFPSHVVTLNMSKKTIRRFANAAKFKEKSPRIHARSNVRE